MILASTRTLASDGRLALGWVRIEGDRIAATGAGPAPDAVDIDFGDDVLAPGLVDIHCHGGGGGSFASGDAAEARSAIATHLRAGTTSLVASLVTDSPQALAAQIEALTPLVRAGDLLGVHLEGPCLSPAHRGAHDPAMLRTPAQTPLGSLAEAGAVVMVTLASELDGGLEAVATLREQGVVVALGHTDATYAQTSEALTAGASVATHLCNAMRGLHHREPGPILACLQDERAFVEVIADGVHLAPEVVAGIFAAAGRRVVLVTDAMSAAGLGDGRARLGRLEVVVRDGVARVATTGAIAGSTLTLARAVRFTVQRAGVDLAAALVAATAGPARALDRTDIGVLSPGARADLAVFDADLAVTAVMHAGSWLARD